jgi:murein DD-endopeptidase MepM/ murein hydrolase activator NlpD
MRFAVLLLVATGAAWPVQAGKVYRWTDAQGVVHYGDRAGDAIVPGREVAVVPVRVEPRAMARLRVVAQDGRNLAWADNLIDGPIEVLLRAEPGAPVTGAPALPARATVPAGGAVVVSHVAAQGMRGSGWRLNLEAIPGDPSARPRDVEYGYPLQSRALRIEQGWGGPYSHTDAENRHAIDLATPVGTPVLAARDGMVMQLEADFDETGQDAGADTARANFIRILHDDGTMAVYAHLQAGGVLVRSGQRVRHGDRIGWSGNTGYSGGPHLHFVVQANRGMRLQSIPFKMFGPQGILRLTEPRSVPEE